MVKAFIGVDLGGTKTALGISGPDGEIMESVKFPTEASSSPEAIGDSIVGAIRELAKGRRAELAGVGVGVPSFVDFERGIAVHSPNIPSLKDFPMKAYLEARLECPVYLDNDANLAALAEYKKGAGRGTKDMIYITASTGVGGGFILNGEIYRGTFYQAGEIGHMLVTPGEGLLCGCGQRGCFESHIGVRYIPERVQGRLDKGEATAMTSMAASVRDIDGRILKQAVDGEDPMATSILGDMCWYLGMLCHNLSMVFSIGRIVIGGGLINFGEPFFRGVRDAFESFRREGLFPVEIKPAELKQDFGVIGALELAISLAIDKTKKVDR